MNVSLRNPTGRKTQAHVLSLGPLNPYFSYSTCIAFDHFDKRARLPNHWGPTTGRHFNELGIRDYPTLPDDEFQTTLEALLYPQTIRELPQSDW